MDKMLTYKLPKLQTFNTDLKLEIDINKFLHQTLLNRLDAEREVLDNLSKIEIMQFLGLKDKMGRLIYFGDILIDNMNNLLTPAIEIENAEHVLFFKPIKHLKHHLLNIGCKSTYSQTLEVIGNIYINSELFAGMQETDKLLQLIASVGNYKEPAKRTLQIEMKNPLLN